MPDTVAIAAFRSRQQVMRFESILRRAGVPCRVVSTPRDIAIGCGLSLEVNMEDVEDAIALYNRYKTGNLIGFYQVTRNGSARARSVPIYRKES